MYSNSQILSAVLAKWMQPVINQFAGGKIGSLPFIANIEAKLKSTGWVSPMWSLGNEIAPLVGGIGNKLIEPMIAQYLNGVPDDAIPSIAHQIVQDSIKNGGLKLFEGKVEFEVADLEELQKLLRYNLPIKETQSYEVLTEEPKTETL